MEFMESVLFLHIRDKGQIQDSNLRLNSETETYTRLFLFNSEIYTPFLYIT